MSTLNTAVLPSPVAGLRQYIHYVQSLPTLDAEEERELAEQLQRDNDIDAAWRLVSSHLRYVVNIARGYAGYGLPQEDLIQEGNVGLMKAVRRFDPSRGVRLLAYAVYWIRAEIHEFILNNWRMVKLATTRARRRLFYKLRSTQQRLHCDEAETIAKALDVSPRDVVDMEARLQAPDESLDSDGRAAAASYTAGCYPEPEAIVAESEFAGTASDALKRALSSLDDRSREIIERRWLVEDRDQATLQELGERYGVSAERIRQLEAAAIEKLRIDVLPRLGLKGRGIAC